MDKIHRKYPGGSKMVGDYDAHGHIVNNLHFQLSDVGDCWRLNVPLRRGLVAADAIEKNHCTIIHLEATLWWIGGCISKRIPVGTRVVDVDLAMRTIALAFAELIQQTIGAPSLSVEQVWLSI